MKEPANIHMTNAQSTPADTVYGMPAYIDRAAAVGEVHARPHLLIQALEAYCSSLYDRRRCCPEIRRR